MTSVGISDVVEMLPELIRAAQDGEHVLITREGVAVAQIGPPPRSSESRPVVLGGMEGQIRFLPGWDDPITEEELLGETAPRGE